MPLFGAHLSIAGGYYLAADCAGSMKTPILQMFTKSNNQWQAKKLTQEEIDEFRDHFKSNHLQMAIAHNSYLINLASPKKEVYDKSVEAMAIEMDRAEALGIRYLVMHPGAHLDQSEEKGIAQIARSLDNLLVEKKELQVQLLLETTAGQGSCLGHRFEQLRAILDLMKKADKIGICLDTCHIFAAGYDWVSPQGYEDTFREFDRLLGLNSLKVFHINDSVRALGSRVDRHANLGKGLIGRKPFERLILDERFENHPMILETPPEEVRKDLTWLRRVWNKAQKNK